MTQNRPGIQNIVHNEEVKTVLDNQSSAQKERKNYHPKICGVFEKPYTTIEETDAYTFHIHPEAGKKLSKIIRNKVELIKGSDTLDPEAKKRYEQKRRIGLVFSGGPAPGGHNVIAGIFDAAKQASPQSEIIGFLLGPDGIMENEYIEITKQMVDDHRNLGGFGMIKTGRAKIDTKEKMAVSRKNLKAMNIDALVIIGGDDSNTNAAFLAQEMYDDGIQIIGVPKTIDGDIQVRDAKGQVLCAMSFGFHTAARAFAGEIANLCTDSSSDVKYWHICKVMGRVASHLALEVALQTHANMTLIGEDIADYLDENRLEKARKQGGFDYNAFGMTLRHLSRVICDGIVRRAKVGKNYGVIVLPEGLLEFINEIQVFIIKLNTIIADYNSTHDNDFHADFPLLEDKLEYLRRLARRSREDHTFTVWNTRDDDLFNDIPGFFQEGLLMERDSHGNFQFSQVETDKVIMGLVKDYLNYLKEEGVYKIGLKRALVMRILEESGLNPDIYGPVVFENYENGEYLLVKPSIISIRTLQMELMRNGLLEDDGEIPKAIKKLFQQSSPKFKTQTHFYGYDGRGNDPTRFDCNYTYNLGLTVFSLIANGATGQMAAIKNLEKTFDRWEPMGIPIAPLMHLEERKGKLNLVIEKSIVDVHSPALSVVREYREKWLAAETGPDNFRKPGPVHFTGDNEEDRPLTLIINSCMNYMENG